MPSYSERENEELHMTVVSSWTKWYKIKFVSDYVVAGQVTILNMLVNEIMLNMPVNKIMLNMPVNETMLNMLVNETMLKMPVNETMFNLCTTHSLMMKLYIFNIKFMTFMKLKAFNLYCNNYIFMIIHLIFQHIEQHNDVNVLVK